MLSVASVRSASGAANYFAKDNYYTGEQASEASAWGGSGAKELGLKGEVSHEAFERLLDGKLPDGTVVNSADKRVAGIDLTFSAPKSVTVLAYIAGDKRIFAAQERAVGQAMAHVEKLAEARDYSRTKNGEGVRTGNLVYATFQHDTSRRLDPQLHTHAVIAAITRTAKGEWRALFNPAIWKQNTTIGSIYHASLRHEMQTLGYQTVQTGKHGQFEVRGVPENVREAFSQRRQDILAKAAELGRDKSETETLRAITTRTRDPKLNVEDRDALRAEWKGRAAALGFDGKSLVEAARSAVERPQGREGRIGIGEPLKTLLGELRGMVGDYLRPYDPLTTNGLDRGMLKPSELRTEMAVASAIRILGQREAAFETSSVLKTALDLGVRGVTADKVEARITTLAAAGKLIPGTTDRLDRTVTHLTTPEHIAEERRLLAALDEGRGKGLSIVPAAAAPERLQAYAGERPLNGEQLAAATLALSSPDRVVVVQGVAGAGKTTMVSAIARTAEAEGKRVLGLAFANKMVAMLRNEARIEAQTVSSFVNQHLRGALQRSGPNAEQSREALKDTVLVLDEASLVANKPMLDLATIANNLGVDRLVMIGDRQQLQPIDAGKAFSLIQSHEPSMARLEESQRQTTDHMKAVAALTREGNFRTAFEVLGERVSTQGKDYRQAAADKWLALPEGDRDRTALYASGRDTRAELNALVQTGLLAEGALKGAGIEVTTLLPVNATREDLRYPETYRAGMVLDVIRHQAPLRLARGRYEVQSVDAKGRVTLTDENGRTRTIKPANIDPKDKRDTLQLAEKERIRLHEGDKIRWTANDKDRGLLNSESARILEATADGIRIETAHGQQMMLAAGDPMLERLGLSYAINMHQAQGMTSDMGIGVMHSAERHLSNQRLAHVMATRVREDIEIVTNDKDLLLRAIENNPGHEASALETIGEKKIDPVETKTSNSTRDRESGSAQPADLKDRPGMSRESFQFDPNEKRGPSLPVPERNLDLSL